VPETPVDPATPSGAETPKGAGESSPGGVLAGAVRGLVALLAGKLRLAELELSRDLSGLGTTVGILAAVVILLVLVLVFAGAGAALLLGEAIGSAGLGLLLVAGVYLLAALLFVLAGRKRLRRLRNFLGETRADIKRDAEWLRSLQ
jgi:hypothetical protein